MDAKKVFSQILILSSAYIFTACSGGFTISGTVLDEDDEPIDGAIVLIEAGSTCCTDEEDDCEATTNSSGEWSHRFRPEGFEESGDDEDEDKDDEKDKKKKNKRIAYDFVAKKDKDKDKDKKKKGGKGVDKINCDIEVSADGFESETDSISVCDNDCETGTESTTETILKEGKNKDDDKRIKTMTTTRSPLRTTHLHKPLGKT